MHDDHDLLSNLWTKSPPSRSPAVPKDAANGDEHAEEACAAFGFLRSTRDKALFVEFRLKNGNTESYPYSLLGSVRFNPSVGLLLKFSGDVTTLVLICGSNLDVLLEDRTVNLLDRGINRHRVVWIREMDEDEVRKTPKGQPTIDRIEVAEFESAEEQRVWIEKTARELMR